MTLTRADLIRLKATPGMHGANCKACGYLFDAYDTPAPIDDVLSRLGFAIDWSCTGPAEGYWSGTIDAAGRGMIQGDCRGEVVTGDTAAEFYRNAIAFAEAHGPPRLCTDPDCEFHRDTPLKGTP